jgi:hypothetical protein
MVFFNKFWFLKKLFFNRLDKENLLYYDIEEQGGIYGIRKIKRNL